MPPRDTQKSRVYEGERIAARRIGMEPSARTIPNDQLQAWVDAALDRRPIRSRWGAVSIRVDLKRGGSAYAYGTGVIKLPLFARNEWVILHEVAHCLVGRSQRYERGCPVDVASHGPEFVGVYLFLVKTVLGDEAYKSYLAVCREKRIRRNNDAIPAVMANVPPPRAERAKARRKADKEKAQAQIRRWVRDGVLTKADVRRLAA